MNEDLIKRLRSHPGGMTVWDGIERYRMLCREAAEALEDMNIRERRLKEEIEWEGNRLEPIRDA
jgi:hypothetical protein